MCSNDRTVREEELESMEAIYGDDFSLDSERTCAIIHIPSGRDAPHITLRVHLPESYPSMTAPVAELMAEHLPDEHDSMLQQLEAAWKPGEVVLFEWCQILCERHSAWEEAKQAHPGSSRERCDDPEPGRDTERVPVELEDVPEAPPSQGASSRWQAVHTAGQEDRLNQIRGLIVSGQPLTERKSTFQAHVAPVSSLSEVEAVMTILLENNAIRRATHNIMAYRFVTAGGHCQDFDDDGEAAAGARLLHLMQAAKIEGVVVVVSRWFGGVLLGPSRFALINNTARSLLQELGYISAGKTNSTTGNHKGGSRK